MSVPRLPESFALKDFQANGCETIRVDPPPLNGSTRRYFFGHEKEGPNGKKASPTCLQHFLITAELTLRYL